VVKKVLLTLLVTMSPISELRGAIPLGIVEFGLNPWLTLLLAIVANAFIFFPVFFLLRLFYEKLFCRVPLFPQYLENLRRRGKPKVERYGFWGLALFVAVPLPMTGAYTGTMLAWLLDMNWKRAFRAVALGVLVAGLVVFLVTVGIVGVGQAAG
jgi:uncharacterized membrane protein